MVRALVCQADGRVFESNQWLSFDFQILSYLLRFKIRVSTLCASFRTSHSWAYSPVTAVWSPSGQLAGCGLDYGCGRRRTMSIPVRLRAAILGAKRSYSCSSDCLVLRLCQLLSSIYDQCRFALCNRLVGVTWDVSEVYSRWRSRCHIGPWGSIRVSHRSIVTTMIPSGCQTGLPCLNGSIISGLDQLWPWSQNLSICTVSMFKCIV